MYVLGDKSHLFTLSTIQERVGVCALLSTRRHQAHPAYVPILHVYLRKTQALWRANSSRRALPGVPCSLCGQITLQRRQWGLPGTRGMYLYFAEVSVTDLLCTVKWRITPNVPVLYGIMVYRASIFSRWYLARTRTSWYTRYFVYPRVKNTHVYTHVETQYQFACSSKQYYSPCRSYNRNIIGHSWSIQALFTSM